MRTWSLTLQENHLHELETCLPRVADTDDVVALLCGVADVLRDPWDGEAHRKLLSFEVVTGRWESPEQASALRNDAAKQGRELVLVRRAQETDPALPAGLAAFDPDSGLITLGPEELSGRTLGDENNSPRLIRVVGDRFRLHYPGRGNGYSLPALQRQALALGHSLNQDLSKLRVGIVGCGATGSAVAMLLPRLGVGQLLVVDQDIVEASNLNRLHGARQADADALRPKVEVVHRNVSELGLGTRIVPLRAWATEPKCFEALKSCDLIFGCTDDHQGRVLLNRLAYFYLIPVIDMGLAIEVSQTEPPEIMALDGRVTVLGPNHTCLLCREVVDPRRARDEGLRRADPAEYQRRKKEAYVFGEGNASPAVVTFTTEVATMAVNEMLHRLQGFRGSAGHHQQLTRLFHRGKDLRQATAPREGCTVCRSRSYWGRGDMDPSLDLIL